MDPAQESALKNILGKATKMPVIDVFDGIAVQPNHAYVIPPNKSMTIRNGSLRLSPRAAFGLQHTIDEFAISLAEDQKHSAVGVVLSGTGSDGTSGLAAIKAAGGITFAQQPDSAKWSAMPKNAITKGTADFILPPDRIAAELARIGNQYDRAEIRKVPDDSELDQICVILQSATGVDLRLYKQPIVRRRIARRMALQKVGSLSEYARLLRQNQDEAEALADDIVTRATSFFSHPACFQALRKHVLSKLCHDRPASEPIRIWVPGCFSGEEVYSVAMLLLEEFPEQPGRTKIQIFGSDIRYHAVQKARVGFYKHADVKGVSPPRLNRFFAKADEGYRIRRSVREVCLFMHHDVAQDPPFSKLDLIVCRNLLIYRQPAVQKRLLSIFHYALKPGGFVFLGKLDSMDEASSLFGIEDAKNKIFFRKPSPKKQRTARFADLFPPPAAIPSPNLAADFQTGAEAFFLEHDAPPALILDSDLRILYSHGDTSPYVAPASRQSGLDLPHMVRPELARTLRAALAAAKRAAAEVSRDTRVVRHGHLVEVRLDVRPWNVRDSEKRHFLVLFEEGQPQTARVRRPATRGKSTPETIARLEQEIAETREQMQALIAEHEITQEEMQAVNEELSFRNEELQSTNEELETTSEELHSSNEELQSTNEELGHRNAELNLVTQELSNVLVGVDIPVLFLDAGLRIRRFTPGAAALFNLIQNDVGRPFGHFATNLIVEDWDALLAEANDRGRSIEQEVRDKSGHRYSLRVRPFKADGDTTQGALVVLLDTDLLYRALDDARAIVETAHEALAVLDTELRVLSANRSFRRLIRGRDLTEKHPPFLALADGQFDVPGLREHLADALSKQRELLNFEIDRHFPEIGRRYLVLNARPIADTATILVAIEDLTERKRAQEEIQTAEATIRSLLESSAQSIIAVDSSEKIMIANSTTEQMFGYKREELLGQPLEILVPEEARERHIGHHRVFFRDARNRPMGIGMELEGRRKDGTTFPVEVGLSVIQSPMGKLGVAFTSDISERKRMEKVARTHAEEVRALAAQLFTAQEEERRRVSRELHDQICQQLASLAMDLGGLETEAMSPDTAKRIKVLQARAVKASEQTRHIAYELHPSVLEDLGLVASLRDLCKDFSERAGIPAEFNSSALPSFLPLEVAACFYRVSQEALQNVTSHSKATQVSIAVTFDNGKLRLSIADDGVGFDPKAAKGRGGLGLVSMEERARLVGATFSATSKPGEGTRIAVSIPLPLASHEAGKDPGGR